MGDQGNHNTPILLSYLNDIAISVVSAGAAHSVAISGIISFYTYLL